MNLNRTTLSAMSALLVCVASSALAADGPSNQASTQLQAGDPTGFDLGAVTGKFNGLLQLWTIGNSATTTSDQTMRLRRAEMKLSGSIANAPKYFLMVDPAKLIKPAGTTKDIRTSAMIQDIG